MTQVLLIYLINLSIIFSQFHGITEIVPLKAMNHNRLIKPLARAVCFVEVLQHKIHYFLNLIIRTQSLSKLLLSWLQCIVPLNCDTTNNNITKLVLLCLISLPAPLTNRKEGEFEDEGETVFHQQELGLIMTMYHETDKHWGVVGFQDKTGSVVVRHKVTTAGGEEQESSVSGSGSAMRRERKKRRRAAVQCRGIGVTELDLARIATLQAAAALGAQGVV